jgi:hypothetical protein
VENSEVERARPESFPHPHSLGAAFQEGPSESDDPAASLETVYRGRRSPWCSPAVSPSSSTPLFCEGSDELGETAGEHQGE